MPNNKWTGTAVSNFTIIKSLIAQKPQDDELNDLFRDLAQSVLAFLDGMERLPLASKVSGKQYFAFQSTVRHSRSVNANLYGDFALVKRFLKKAKAKQITKLTRAEITSACYTLSIGFACVIDLLNPGDQQTPGSLFQYLVTHLLSRELHTNPLERVKVKIGDDLVSLTMDLVLESGEGKPRYHVAIKTSTRERASEFWAQQRILNQAFEGKYVGYFFGLSETKLDHQKLEVVEICVPDQWRAYQYYLAPIKAIYYLDPPDVYLQLKNKSGGVNVKPFGDFFFEVGGDGD